MSRTAAGWARLAGGAAIIAVLVWRLGTAPFLQGLRTVDGSALLAAISITGLTTACSAARWRLIARALGTGLSLPAAIAAYYRSQFLNSALPGGVLGDLHRGLRQGRDTGDVGRGVRAMVWDRVAGQLVQAVLAVPVLLLPASPVRSAVPLVAVPVLAGALLAAVALSRLPTGRPARLVRTVRAELRQALLGRPALISASSLVVVAGHTAIFLVAARATGTPASLARLLPLAMLALLAMSVPLSLGGWGAREGVAAWAFGATGLGADQGVATATVYGVLAFAATLPGAVVLVVGWLRAAPARAAPAGTASAGTAPACASAGTVPARTVPARTAPAPDASHGSAPREHPPRDRFATGPAESCRPLPVSAHG